MDAPGYLIRQAEQIEAKYPKSKCILRVAGALRAAAADLETSTDNKLKAYIIEAYSHHN